MSDGDEVLETFERPCYWINSAFARVMEIERKQPNYVAALLAVIGCEALGRLCGHVQEDWIFVEELILPKGVLDRGMAGDLFDVLRNGLAHTFDTNFIKLPDGTRIEIVVSWKESPHLSRRPGDPPGIYLNCTQMRLDLDAIYARYRQHLRGSSHPGRVLPDTWTRKRDKPAQPDSVPGWQRFIAREHRS
jgi:hypothetical protein